jgi:hypothetical protein
VFVLCTGRVKLSTCSHEGKTIITKISQPGDVLGLNAVISNRPSNKEARGMKLVCPGSIISAEILRRSRSDPDSWSRSIGEGF